MSNRSDEVWVTIKAVGPPPAIELLKNDIVINAAEEAGDTLISFLKFAPEPKSYIDEQGLKLLTVPSWVYGHNFRNERSPHPQSYEFSFDLVSAYPNELFEAVASRFPTLSFHCYAIGSEDEFVGHGWYNGQPGTVGYYETDVPENYWEI